MADTKEDAALGLLCLAAYALRGPISVPSSGALFTPGWDIQGYLTAKDSILKDEAGDRVYYGFLARSKADPTEWVAAIRGTIDLVEWGENAECAMEKHPVVGEVEVGFYDIYKSLQLDGIQASVAIPWRIGPGARLTVVGHSLGAATGSYLTFDVGRMPASRVRARLFASPHPGNGAFASAFDSTVADYVSYAYDLDVVPRVPFGFGYSHLPKTQWLKPHNGNAQIKFSLECHHSMVSYIAMLDPVRLTEAAALDPECADCAKCL